MKKHTFEQITKEIKQTLTQLGAVPNTTKEFPLYSFTIPNTIYGPLFLDIGTNPKYPTLFTIFSHTELLPPLRYPDMSKPNPYNGKWNFHFNEDTPLESMLLTIKSAISKVLTKGE